MRNSYVLILGLWVPLKMLTFLVGSGQNFVQKPKKIQTLGVGTPNPKAIKMRVCLAEWTQMLEVETITIRLIWCHNGMIPARDAYNSTTFGGGIFTDR